MARIRLSCSYLIFIFIFLISATKNSSAQTKITDTVYYNNIWEICEQPIASYYRIGSLEVMDSFWYYTGNVKDYTINGLLIMEGEYSENGFRNGTFKFYYANGKLSATGDYEKGNATRNWRYYYPSGAAEAEIYFPPDGQDFKFITFKDESGKILLENGTGKFTWNTNIFDIVKGMAVNGSFNSGKRSGIWVYIDPFIDDDIIFKEWYNKDGSFKKARFSNSNRLAPTRPCQFKFSPPRLQIIENIVYDNFFRKNGDSVASAELFEYLANHKPADIKLKFNNFDSAFAFIIQSLYGYGFRFGYKYKDIDEDIEFRLGFKGYPEDITVTGNGLDTIEKKFLAFYLSKFSNIEMPGTKTIAIEGYHDIYMYTIDVRPYFPAEVRSYFGNELFFTAIKKDKMKMLLEENKKDIKKFLRKMLSPD